MWKLLGILSLFASVAAFGKAPAISLDQYLKTYLGTSEDLAIEQSRLKSDELSQEIAGDVFQSQLSLTPSMKNQRTQSFTSGVLTTDLEDSSQSLDAAYTQATPWGITGEVGFEQALEEDDLASTRTTQAWSLGLSKSLNRDLFGRSTRAARSGAEDAARGGKWELDEQWMKSCEAGIGLYSQAYLDYQREQSTLSVLKLAEQSLKISRRAAKKKQIRKVDSLALESEALRVRSRYEAAKVQAFKSMEDFRALAELDGARRLTNPERFLQGDEFYGNDDLDSSQLKALRAQMESAKWNELRAKYQSGSEITLGASLTDTDGETLNGAVYDDFEDQTLLVSLTWDLNLINSSLSATHLSALESTKQAELAYRKAQKSLQATFESTKQSQASSKRVVKLLTQQVKILEKQVKEGLRLLRVGKININDYINYQDRLLSEKLSLLSEKSRLWSLNLTMARMRGKKQIVCLGVSE